MMIKTLDTFTVIFLFAGMLITGSGIDVDNLTQTFIGFILIAIALCVFLVREELRICEKERAIRDKRYRDSFNAFYTL